jgi:hypothetical protein
VGARDGVGPTLTTVGEALPHHRHRAGLCRKPTRNKSHPFVLGSPSKRRTSHTVMHVFSRIQSKAGDRCHHQRPSVS